MSSRTNNKKVGVIGSNNEEAYPHYAQVKIRDTYNKAHKAGKRIAARLDAKVRFIPKSLPVNNEPLTQSPVADATNDAAKVLV